MTNDQPSLPDCSINVHVSVMKTGKWWFEQLKTFRQRNVENMRKRVQQEESIQWSASLQDNQKHINVLI